MKGALLIAISAAAIWFAAEVYLRPEPGAQDMSGGATGLYGLTRIPGYTGPVAKIQRDDNHSTADVGTLDDMRQFCARTTCVVRTMYDQSGGGTHLHKAN